MNTNSNHCGSFNDPDSSVSSESARENILKFPVLPAEETALPAQEPALPAGLPAPEASLPAKQTALPAQEPALPAGLPAPEVSLPAKQTVLPAQKPALPAGLPAPEASLPAKQTVLPAQEAETDKSRNRQEMPYERFLSCGAGSLTNAELLAIVLRTGTKEKNATQLSREILGFYKEGTTDLSALHRLTREDLMSIPGIGEVKAVKILSLAEISKRLVRERAAKNLVFSSPASVADYYMEELRHLETETAILVMLDNRLALLREEVLSHGTVNCTLLSPREIFLRALRWGAVNIMLLHNHPSGDPTPSRMDLEVTGRICKVGNLLGIHLIDHLVIGDLSYTSLRECGCITDSVPDEPSGAEEDSSDVFQGDLF